VDIAWNIPRIQSYPFSDSAYVYYDTGPTRNGGANGTDVPPIENLPNRSGDDPHGDPRNEASERQMVSDFLRPNAQSAINDSCGSGIPCFAGGFTGP
jgi:hypothetical protein